MRADGGKTWELGAVGQTGTRESQVVQVPSKTADAQLYGTERNMGAKPGDLLRHESRIIHTCNDRIAHTALMLILLL